MKGLVWLSNRNLNQKFLKYIIFRKQFKNSLVLRNLSLPVPRNLTHTDKTIKFQKIGNLSAVNSDQQNVFLI